jgi:hypothetical protein
MVDDGFGDEVRVSGGDGESQEILAEDGKIGRLEAWKIERLEEGGGGQKI